MTRYEAVRLAQLVFALSMMFGAFLGGIAVGWLRWARPADQDAPRSTVPRPEPMVPRVIKHDLFSPQTEPAQVVDLTVAPFSPAELTAAHVDRTTGAIR